MREKNPSDVDEVTLSVDEETIRTEVFIVTEVL